MFKPKYIKQGKLLRKGVKKFLHYKRDLLSEERLEEIEGKLTEFEEALETKEKEPIEKAAKRLTGTCEKAVPSASYSGLRENLEVVFVAVVIAVGIRAYFLQPFKIPTGSMQPTLNGIIAYEQSEEEFKKEKPGFVGGTFKFVTHGRKYVNEVMEEDEILVMVKSGTNFKFFPYTDLHFQSGKVKRIKLPVATLTNKNGPGGTGFAFLPLVNTDGKFVPMQTDKEGRLKDGQGRVVEGVPLKKGHVIARGYVDTGDQVLVDKISYHFRSPNRGEVFVFSTKNIDGIVLPNKEEGSQHYIKRLVGVPGDTLEVRDPPAEGGEKRAPGQLFVNGEKATEPGIVKVMDEYPESHPASHRGYVRESGTIFDFDLNDEDNPVYVAMGDNSKNSADSRSWGTVPEVNIVGPAFVVYWPFAHHWGRIR